VGGLVGGDGLQVLVEGVGETGSDEVGLGVVRKTLPVKLVLEVLKGKSVVEDVDYKVLARKPDIRSKNHTISDASGSLTLGDDWAS